MFGNVSFFAGDGFAGVQSINSAMLSLVHKMFLQMEPWFWQSIPLAASWMQCSLQETSEKLSFVLCLSCMCRALLRGNLHISVFCTCASHPKVALVSSGTICLLVSWYFEPSQPQRITSQLKTKFNLSPIDSARKSTNHKSSRKTKSVLTQTYTKHNIHKHQKQNFQRISSFSITPVKKSTDG